MNRAEKQAEIELVTNGIKNSALALCVDYRGLKVTQVTDFRRKSREKGATVRVVKNTLLRIAAKNCMQGKDSPDVDKFLGLFDGPSMLIWSADPVTSAKAVAEFAKTNKEMSIKGAWVDGAFLDAAGVDALSKLPGREETLGMLLNLILAPATQLVRLLSAPGTQIVRAIDAYREKLEANS